jgi:Mg2+/Co2+ transporter CorB
LLTAFALLIVATALFMISLSVFHKGRVMQQRAEAAPRNEWDDTELLRITVSDIMVPRNDVSGIDLEDNMSDILSILCNSLHTRLPVYTKDLNSVIGVLHMRDVPRLMRAEEPNKAELVQLTREAYFVPESTPVKTQLMNFQKQRRNMALVVDEYGEVKGLVTLEDLLEELVNHFTANSSDNELSIIAQPDGSFLIDGTTYIRDINRALGWHLPTDGPKTLNGLLTEWLESIPEPHVGVSLPEHRAEILQVKENLIKTVRIWHQPQLSDTSLDTQATLHD